MEKVEVKSNEVLRRALKGHTRKRYVYVVFTDQETVRQPYWDGGSRSEYFFLSTNGERRSVRTNKTKWPAIPGETTVDIHKTALVSGGVFCGKIAGLTLHINPSDKGIWGFAN